MIKKFLNIGDSMVISEKLPELNVGDVVRVGRFKNKKATIEGFGKDKHGQPIIKTNKGEYQVFKFRVEKLMPEQ